MKQKKVLSFVLALCLVFALSVTALAASFSDVSSSHWANDEISDVVSRGIFLGTSATTFEPEADMTRAMFVTVLSRLAAADVDDSAATNFADVATGVWYTGAVAWGTSNNIVQGLSATTFGPDQAITREQLATLIQRYVDFAGVTLPETQEAVEFTDADEIGDYAKDAVAACQKAGLINGMEDGSYQPKATATRAQVAAIISRLAEIDKAITYTVSFDSNGGSDVAAQKVKGGEVATKPANPTKDGASFDGWYTDSALTAEYDFSTPVQANFTLYAKWNESGSSSGGSSGGGGGGSSNGTKVEETATVLEAQDADGGARTDVAVTVREKASSSKVTYNITLANAAKNALISPDVKVSYTDLSPAFDATGVPQEVEGIEVGFTAFAINFEKSLAGLVEDADMLKVVQTNAALEMFATDPRVEQINGKWTKNGNPETASTISFEDLKADNGAFVALQGEDITFKIYKVVEGEKDTLIATYNIDNNLKFGEAGSWTGAGAEPAATYVDGVESSVATGTTQDGVPTAQMTVSGSVNTNLPINDETAKSDMASVLTETGAPKGEFTIVGVDLGAMLKGIGIEGVDTLTIVQQNPALKMFKDVDPTNDTIKQEGSVWTKTASYATSTFDSEKYNVALNGKTATILVKDGEGEDAEVLLEVVIANSGLKFTDVINNVASLELALENATADSEPIKLDKAFYDSLENAAGPLVISAGDSSIPVTIEGNSGKALPVGVQIQRGNITLKNVNVGADEADLLADVNGTKAGIAVYVTADNQALKNVTLDNCNVVLSGDFGTSPVDGIHVFGDASQAATGSVKNCAITLTDVTSQDNKINGIELGAPDVEVTDNTIKGATRGIYASWVGADDEINISGNIVNLRETEFVNSAEYFIWYTGEAAPADFGTANSTAIPEKVAEWLEAGELENGQSVIVCYSDASALEKYEQSKDGQTSYYYDAEAAEGDGAWVDMAETPDVEEPGTGEEEGGEAPAPTPGEGE